VSAGGDRTASGRASPPAGWDTFDRVLDARSTPMAEQLRQVWAYRELLALLVWRDVKVRYRRSGRCGFSSSRRP